MTKLPLFRWRLVDLKVPSDMHVQYQNFTLQCCLLEAYLLTVCPETRFCIILSVMISKSCQMKHLYIQIILAMAIIIPLKLL